jgi:hypothetical protein
MLVHKDIFNGSVFYINHFIRYIGKQCIMSNHNHRPSVIPALGLQNTAGVKGSIVDNVMKLSFAQQVKTTKIAKIEEVVNAAAGLCNKAEKRAVYGTSTQIKTYNYSFTGTKQ